MNESNTPDARIPSVSEITRQIRELLEPAFSELLVEGELSNINRSRNGHYYLTLKDSDAQLPCVIWNRTAARLGMEPEDGQQVILGGSIQIYPPHGRYQLIVRTFRQAGIGRLQQAFEQLKKKLRDEGLFDAPKKNLPPFPGRIGVITSATGAARHDITSTLEQRWPLVHVVLYHASVQGVHSAPELVRAINALNERDDLDLIIIGRGGGSLEDLWPFNEEAVARAIFASRKPVISAVGHEVDFSISDFTADHRAATPTQAAVMATPDINEIRMYTDELGNRISQMIRETIDRHQRRISELSNAHGLLAVREKLRSHQVQLTYISERIQRNLERQLPDARRRVRESVVCMERRNERLLNKKRERLTSWIHRLETCNPNRPLAQGYVRVWQGGRWIRTPGSLEKERSLELEWKEKRITL